MSDAPNPYAAPSVQPPLSPTKSNLSFEPASQGQRFLNLIIDYFAQFAVSFTLGITVVLIGGEEAATTLEKIPDIVLGMPIVFAYYFIFEATTSRTLGKLLTGTKVVNEDGSRPTIGQIAGRSLCRLIPFEAFSFFGTPTRGWHDSIPRTYVVKAR